MKMCSNISISLDCFFVIFHLFFIHIHFYHILLLISIDFHHIFNHFHTTWLYIFITNYPSLKMHTINYDFGPILVYCISHRRAIYCILQQNKLFIQVNKNAGHFTLISKIIQNAFCKRF